MCFLRFREKGYYGREAASQSFFVKNTKYLCWICWRCSCMMNTGKRKSLPHKEITIESLDGKELSSQIRKRIQEETGAMIPVYVIETESLNRKLEHAPVWWGTDDKGIYDNLVFILTEETPEEICAQIGEPSDGWEQISLFEDVIFWSFDLKYYQKCNWWKKTATNGIAEKLTIRTANTVRKD